MTENTRTKIIELVTASFQMNSFCDNIAYNLDEADFMCISEVFHLRFAHKFPEFADILTDLMNKLDARAVRGSLNENTEDYDGNVVAMFADVVKECENYRNLIISAIEIADINGDYEVKIALEDFLVSTFASYYKQSRVWDKYAKLYEGNEKDFNIHFAELTTYIA